MAATLILSGFGLALFLQPLRWSETPAYANLLLLMPARMWGFVYMVTAVALIISIIVRERRMVMVMAHTLAFILLTIWDVAFFIRWVTDPHTTVANWIAWTLYAAVVVRSGVLLDRGGIVPGHEVVVE